MFEFLVTLIGNEQTSLLGFMGLGPMELMLVGVAAVLLFGRNLPQVARSAGKSLTEFKKGMQDLQEEVRVSIDTDANVVASNRSTPVTPDTSDDESDKTLDGDSDTEDSWPEESINDDDDEELHSGYPEAVDKDAEVTEEEMR